MRKLLLAQCSRLLKNKVFWLELLFMFVMGVCSSLMPYLDNVRYGEHSRVDDMLFNYIILMGLCTPVFCSLFSGTEYSDGTIRNKLIVGHTRWSVYCSSLLVSLLASVFVALAFVLPYTVLGFSMLEAPKASMGTILLMALLSLFVIAEFVSIFHMLSMLITKKSTSAIICMLAFIMLFVLAVVIKGKLDAPEFVQNYSMTIDGLELMSPEPNPKYLQPEARRVYQFFFEVLPSGQSLQIAAIDVVHPYLLMLYSAVISAAITVLGIFFFKKKNLK